MKQRQLKSSNRESDIFTENIHDAVKVLRSGGIVAFPTETSYGLAADIFNISAVEQVYAVKKRNHTKPLLVLISSPSELDKLVMHVPESYELLINHFWPGPLTLIFKVSEKVPECITAGTGTIGIRISSDPAAHELCSAYKGPITATSANISGEIPANTHDEVEKQFGSALQCIYKKKRTPIQEGSTILFGESGDLRCIREGAIRCSEINNLLRNVNLDCQLK